MPNELTGRRDFMNILNNFPLLETERFLLRPIEAGDANEVFLYFSRNEVTMDKELKL